MTAGTATAETEGELIDGNGPKVIRNGLRRAVHPGDGLYVPPGVPHHFVDPSGFRAFLVRFSILPDPDLSARRSAPAVVAGAGGGGAAEAPEAPPNKP